MGRLPFQCDTVAVGVKAPTRFRPPAVKKQQADLVRPACKLLYTGHPGLLFLQAVFKHLFEFFQFGFDHVGAVRLPSV